MKSLQVGASARKASVGALEKIASAVATTLGPRGMPFIIEKENSMDGKLSPTITKDGLTVLRSMSFGDPIESAVHHLCVQASSHTVLSAGDGTTSSIVFAAAVAKEIEKSLEFEQKPQKLAREIQKQAAAAIAAIKEEAVKTKEAVRMVAETSTNGDQELTDIVMQIVEKSSSFGSIIIERDVMKKENYQIVVQEGLVAGKGYEKCRQFGNTLSNKVGENSPFSIPNPYVICFDGELLYSTQLTPMLNRISTLLPGSSNIIIAAYEVGAEIQNILAEINLKRKPKAGQNSIQIWAHGIRDGGEANFRWHKMHDLAAFTGGTVLNFADIEKADWELTAMGTCEKVTVSTEKTIFTGRGPKHWIATRAFQNQNAADNARSMFDKEHVMSRNAELTSGLVKLVVGGGHTASIQERADRADDAIKAAQACMKSGALPGCGCSYIRAGKLAGVGPELNKSLRVVHETILDNYGIDKDPNVSFEAGETFYISDTREYKDDFLTVGLADSFETVSAVIKNGTELGILVSTLGGMSLTTDLEEIEKIDRAAKILGR